MKVFIKQWIFLFGLIMIFSTVVPAMISQEGTFLWQMMGLLFMSFTVCIFNLFIDRIAMNSMIGIHLIRLAMVLAVVYLFGWFLNWYTPEYWWMILVMVIPVYGIYYLVDSIKVNRDVEELNQRIRMKRAGLENEKMEEV